MLKRFIVAVPKWLYILTKLHEICFLIYLNYKITQVYYCIFLAYFINVKICLLGFLEEDRYNIVESVKDWIQLKGQKTS